MENQINALLEAAAIIMKARAETMKLTPIHSQLCRVSDYIDSKAAELLANAKGENS